MNLDQNRPAVKYAPENQDFVRMRYYSKLKDNYQRLDHSFNQAPVHVINEKLYINELQLKGFNVNKRHGSFTIIFSVWNNLVGASLITIPWAFSNAGLLTGSLIVFASFLISFYTTWLIIKLTKDDEDDFNETLERYFGKFGSYLGILSSILILSVPLMFYFQIISQMVYPSILVILNSDVTAPAIDLQPDFEKFSYSYTWVVLFILSLKKDMKVFIRISSVGVVFTLMIIFFIFSIGFDSLATTDFTLVNTLTPEMLNQENSDTRYLQLYSLQFAPLMGMMSGGFYLHNLSIPILKNSEDKSKNVRDVFIGYVLAFLSYLCAGILGYIGFKGESFDQAQITQNCLNMFSPNNPFAFLIRVCVAFLLLSLFPLLLAIMKQQIWILYQKLKPKKIKFRTQQMASLKPLTESFQLTMNVLILFSVAMVGIFYPKAGTLMAILSSIFCFFIIYTIPTICHIKQIFIDEHLQSQIQQNQLADIAIENQLNTSIHSQNQYETSYTPLKNQTQGNLNINSGNRTSQNLKRNLLNSFQNQEDQPALNSSNLNSNNFDALVMGPSNNQADLSQGLIDNLHREREDRRSEKQRDFQFVMPSFKNILIIFIDILVIFYGISVFTFQYIQF